MRKFVPLVAALVVVVAAPAAAQTEPPTFTTVEVVGWDLSAYDERVKDAFTKAKARGAGEAERRAAAEALADRAEFFWEAGNPHFYKYALGDFRHILRLRPDDAGTRERADTIVSIYKSLGRPVPTNGESKSGEGFTVEVFKTTPKRLAFVPGGAYTEGGHVSDRVAFVYEFEALAGQTLSAGVGAKDRDAVFDLLLLDADGPRKLIDGEASKRFRLPSAGKYLLRVYSKAGSAEYELKAELR